MTDADLNRLEFTFNVTLPPLYRRWALELPVPDDEDAPAELLPFLDIDEIVSANEWVRTNDWALNHFVIGDFELNMIFVDLANFNAGVFYAQHDGEPFYDRENIQRCFMSSLEEFFIFPPTAPFQES